MNPRLPGECQYADEEEAHEESQLLACLSQRRQETLKTVEMSDKLQHEGLTNGLYHNAMKKYFNIKYNAMDVRH